jgi:hypothetical protein
MRNGDGEDGKTRKAGRDWIVTKAIWLKVRAMPAMGLEEHTDEERSGETNPCASQLSLSIRMSRRYYILLNQS